jgi:hypothetical protein
MNRVLGVVLLAVASLVLGVILGEFFFRFFQRAIPPAAMGQVSLGWVHTTCLFYGLGVGVVFFVWAFLASSITRLFQRK